MKNNIVIFDSAHEALPFAFKAPWNYVGKSQAPKAYKEVEATVESLFQALCISFLECKQFPKPIVMLTNNGESGSFGLFFDQRQRQSNILLVSQELSSNQKHLEFVIAHELVHYFSLHAQTSTPDQEVSEVYRSVNGKREYFDYPQDQVKMDFLRLIDAMEDLGPRAHLISSAHNLSVSGQMGKLSEAMLREVSKYGPECLRLGIQFKRIKSIQSTGNFLSSLNIEVIRFLETATNCFEQYPGNLLKDTILRENLLKKSSDEITEIIEGNGAELKRLQELHAHKMKTYTSLSQKLGGPQIRFENEEDLADVMAIKLLLGLGRRGMRQYTDYLLTDSSARDQLKCFADLNSNKEPFYGVLINTHHEECWRIWRAQRVEESFLRANQSQDGPF